MMFTVAESDEREQQRHYKIGCMHRRTSDDLLSKRANGSGFYSAPLAFRIAAHLFRAASAIRFRPAALSVRFLGAAEEACLAPAAFFGCSDSPLSAA